MRLNRFRVTNYRNIHDSGWIDVTEITAFVGQNEAGKSNLFDALYRIKPFETDAAYDIDEDWPVDEWGRKNPGALVCEAEFELSSEEIVKLFEATGSNAGESPDSEGPSDAPEGSFPDTLVVVARRGYEGGTTFAAPEAADLIEEKVQAWAEANIPNFVLIQDYGISGTRIELNSLAESVKKVKWGQLTTDEQTLKIVLDLAKVDIQDFLAKGGSPEGRTVRSFDKRAASSYLTKQFRELWSQKKVKFHIEIDGTTLNIFAEDDAVGMPVRLNRRSSGFRWHVSFAWRFTHASKGEYRNCILLLEEPGIHLHYSGQRDLLEVFERLAASNTLLYTTHLASMVDLAFPERVRIVETHGTHASVKKGVVSSQRAPMAVIEMSLGLTGDMGGLLGTRQTLIVEGGDDALVLYKLSGLLRADGRSHLSERVYLWPAHSASKTPMYAAFAAGQGWDAGVLLDSDEAGARAGKKIKDLRISEVAEAGGGRFRVLMLGKAAGIKNTDSAIEDLLGDAFYLECVNATFGIAIEDDDLPQDGSSLISKRMERVLVNRYRHDELDKGRVMAEILKRFDSWVSAKDLPTGIAARAEKLFEAINQAFTE